MPVSQARLDSYRADVDAYGDAAASYVEQYIEALMEESPGMTVAEMRDEAIEAVDEALNAFGDQASTLALDLFEEIMAMYGVEPETKIEDVIPREMVEGGVRYRARDLVEGEGGKFARDVADLSRYYIHRSAFENMERNCGRNDVAYARVPSGREGCAFCTMLSARGFDYTSAKSAGEGHEFHKNCKCVVVPGFRKIPAGEQVEGYDPEGMAERIEMCKETLGGNPTRKELLAEIRTRDVRWLNTGKEPKVDYSNVPRSFFGKMKKRSDTFNPSDYDSENITEKGREWRDLFIHDALKHAGFDVKPMKANAPDGFSNIDSLVGGKLYEFKSPEEPQKPPKRGRELSFVESNLRSAKKQFFNQYDETKDGRLEYKGEVRVVFSTRYRDAEDQQVESEIIRQMRAHDIDEVIFVRKDGNTRRLKK